MPRFVAVACGGNGPPCREVNIVCVCVCVCVLVVVGGLGLLLGEFVQFLREKKTSWETVTEVKEQFPLCRREYSYQLNPALPIL